MHGQTAQGGAVRVVSARRQPGNRFLGAAYCTSAAAPRIAASPGGESGLNDLNLVFIDRDQVLFEVLASGVDEDTARLYWAAEKEKPRER